MFFKKFGVKMGGVKHIGAAGPGEDKGMADFMAGEQLKSFDSHTFFSRGMLDPQPLSIKGTIDILFTNKKSYGKLDKSLDFGGMGSIPTIYSSFEQWQKDHSTGAQ